MRNIELRKTQLSDLDTLYVFQLDEEGRQQAAFMAKDATDKDAYLAKHSRFLSDPTINTQTILLDGVIVGSIAKFIMFGEAEITYWIDRKHWGQGIASAALQQFLKIEPTRPLHGRTAFDNRGSQKVLEKAGFVRVGSDKGFAVARDKEIEEYIYKLE